RGRRTDPSGARGRADRRLRRRPRPHDRELRSRGVEPRTDERRAPAPGRRRALRGEAVRQGPLRRRRRLTAVCLCGDTPAVRRYAIGFQLWLLVVGGVASGYLWRAALERNSPTIRYVAITEPYEPAHLERVPYRAASAKAQPARRRVRRARRHSRPAPAPTAPRAQLAVATQ